jgi:AcrR family transcriptional regulator
MGTATLATREGPPAAPGVEGRLVDAALRCVARWGVAKTTLDDIAREAGCSRATAYRLFPGGKEALLAAVAAHEVRRLLGDLTARLEQAEGLEDRLVAGITTASRAIAGHEAVRYLLVHEPGVVLRHVTFAPYDAVLTAASTFLAPWFEPWVGPSLAARAGEWVTRLVLSFSLSPSPRFDFTDDGDTRRFVVRYLLPGLVPPA